MKCKICEQQTSEFGNGTYYLEDGRHFLVPFFYCRNCDCFIRDVNNDSVFSHLKSASHTNLHNEERFYRERIRFFEYIYSFIEKQKSPVSNWLDFGCSYGHFIDFLKVIARPVYIYHGAVRPGWLLVAAGTMNSSSRPISSLFWVGSSPAAVKTTTRFLPGMM